MNKSIEDRLKVIEARNEKVEGDKAWETSATRRLLIASLTYILIGFYLTWLGVSRPWLNAAVPAIGFLLSTLAIQRVKQVWLKRRK